MTVQPPEPLGTTQLDGRLGHHLNAGVKEKPEAAITKGDYERPSACLRETGQKA
jgi:hypothetical protein